MSVDDPALGEFGRGEALRARRGQRQRHPGEPAGAYSPAPCNLGVVKAYQPGAATAVLTVTSPSDGTVSTELEPKGPFQVTRMTRYQYRDPRHLGQRRRRGRHRPQRRPGQCPAQATTGERDGGAGWR